MMMPPPPPIPVGGNGAPPVPIPPPVPVITPPPVPTLTPPPAPVAPLPPLGTAFDDVPPAAPVVAAPSLNPPPLREPGMAPPPPPPPPRKEEHGLHPPMPPMPPLSFNPWNNPEWEEAAETVGPKILLEPLHVLDPLCVKWNIGIDTGAAEEPGAKKKAASEAGLSPNSHPVFLSSPAARAPSPSKQAEGYVRLLGLLSTGRPWERSLSMSDISKPCGMVIGRDTSYCNVVLPEGSISRRHALLERVNRNVVITDLGSTNGTAVNGRQISPVEQRVPVMDGSILTLGDVTLRVEILEAAPSPVPV